MYSEGKRISVSVIVPIYNTEKYLKQCLDSIRNQTLTDIEIIMIDDGSTDGSAKISNEYVVDDERFSYYHKENEGLAAARQDGMERAKGKYIAFVDSDDWIEPNMYERMYLEAVRNDADIVFCNCYKDQAEENKICLEPGVYERNDIKERILSRTLAGITPKGANDVIRWSNCLRIYRRELLECNDIKFDRRFRRSQDLQLTFEATLCANRYVSINDEYLYHNRSANNDTSLSRGYTENYWGVIKPLIERLYADVCKYQEQNLEMQMHLCTYFFAYQGIINECEKSNKKFKEKTRKIKEIIKDKSVQESLQYVEWKRLNSYYQIVYKGIKSGSVLRVLWLLYSYPARQRIEQSRIVRGVLKKLKGIKKI